jgi:hypothetical protein
VLLKISKIKISDLRFVSFFRINNSLELIFKQKRNYKNVEEEIGLIVYSICKITRLLQRFR